MLMILIINAYLCIFFFIVGLIPVEWEHRPTLSALGIETSTSKKKKSNFSSLVRVIAKFNKPVCQGAMRKRIEKDLAIAHINITPEEFILAKELCIIMVLFVTFPAIKPDMMAFWIFMSLGVGYMLPEIILRNKIKKVKAVMVKELPDAIDLLGLCVNAGLDFMLSLKWVVEKSPPSVMVDELNVVLQEINVGKTRRDAIKDLASRYELPDLSTFARTLIQADKMGTSVTEALNILSEDMRLARYRRGEQLALKAPMKMLVPLLLFIFPVVGIMVAGPILLDFVENNPFAAMGGN